MVLKKLNMTSNLIIEQELREQGQRVNLLASAERLWHDVLTAEDREKLGNNFVECYGRLRTIGMWMTLRGVSRDRAIVDLAYLIGHIDETRHGRLLREIGEQPQVLHTADRPTWNASTGELCYQGQLLRRVRILSSPTNIQLILNAFEQSKWCSSVDNPLSTDAQQLHQALRSLNKGLEKIRFHAQRGAQAITWRLL
jgi:hypothetical protein